MVLDYSSLDIDALSKHLYNPDMRIRQKAQFELVARGDKGLEVFEAALQQRDNQLARVNATWGVGQLARKNKDSGKVLQDLLKDKDPEIVAQAARTIGDIKYAGAEKELISLLSSESPRTVFFSAQALGRIAATDAVSPLIA